MKSSLMPLKETTARRRFLWNGSAEITAEIDLQAGREVPIEIEFSSEGAILMLGCRIGLRAIMERDLLREAEDLAAKSDAAVVHRELVTGKQKEETETRFPPRQSKSTH